MTKLKNNEVIDLTETVPKMVEEKSEEVKQELHEREHKLLGNTFIKWEVLFKTEEGIIDVVDNQIIRLLEALTPLQKEKLVIDGFSRVETFDEDEVIVLSIYNKFIDIENIFNHFGKYDFVDIVRMLEGRE